MNTLFLATNTAGAGAGGNIVMIALLIFAGAFMYFGAIRPQKKQQQQRMAMMDKLKKGDKVVLVDGLHAKIDSINEADKTVVVDADGIYLTFSRMAVRQVLEPSSTESKAETTTATESSDSKEETAEASKEDQD